MRRFKDVRTFWEENAHAWTELARRGFDVYRDYVNTPRFLSALPQVSGLSGLDIGSGEGHNTRLLERRGARMTGVDISGNFLRYASEAQCGTDGKIQYVQGDAEALPFSDSSFDFATAFMSLMGVPHYRRAVGEAFRILRPSGFFQFSINHPCFNTPRWGWTAEHSPALICGDYFRRVSEIKSWTCKAWQNTRPNADLVTFQAPLFRHTLSDWVNAAIRAGFIIEDMAEPSPSNRDVQSCPLIADARSVAFFLIIRCRKPPKIRKARRERAEN